MIDLRYCEEEARGRQQENLRMRHVEEERWWYEENLRIRREEEARWWQQENLRIHRAEEARRASHEELLAKWWREETQHIRSEEVLATWGWEGTQRIRLGETSDDHALRIRHEEMLAVWVQEETQRIRHEQADEAHRAAEKARRDAVVADGIVVLRLMLEETGRQEEVARRKVEKARKVAEEARKVAEEARKGAVKELVLQEGILRIWREEAESAAASNETAAGGAETAEGEVEETTASENEETTAKQGGDTTGHADADAPQPVDAACGTKPPNNTAPSGTVGTDSAVNTSNVMKTLERKCRGVGFNKQIRMQLEQKACAERANTKSDRTQYFRERDAGGGTGAAECPRPSVTHAIQQTASNAQIMALALGVRDECLTEGGRISEDDRPHVTAKLRKRTRKSDKLHVPRKLRTRIRQFKRHVKNIEFHAEDEIMPDTGSLGSDRPTVFHVILRNRAPML